MKLSSIPIIGKFARAPKKKLTPLEVKIAAVQNKDVEELKKELAYYKKAKQWHCDTYSKLPDVRKMGSPAKKCIDQINESIEIAQNQLNKLVKETIKTVG